MIREFETSDENYVAGIWHRAGLLEYTYLPAFQALDSERALAVFRSDILSACNLWVEASGPDIRGFIALNGAYVDRLYVDPQCQGLGIGTRLIQHAKNLNPAGLNLHTHQQNVRACNFYESLGFEAVAFGISPAPELIPDVEYRWRHSPCGVGSSES